MSYEKKYKKYKNKYLELKELSGGGVEYEYNNDLNSIKIVNGEKNTTDDIIITRDHIDKILVDLNINKINKVFIGKSITMILDNAFSNLEIE
jgi:hypothetical protein